VSPKNRNRFDQFCRADPFCIEAGDCFPLFFLPLVVNRTAFDDREAGMRMSFKPVECMEPK
jgi:hypothetical protein